MSELPNMIESKVARSRSLLVARDFLVDYSSQRPVLTKGDGESLFESLFPASDLDDVIALANRLPAEVVELIGKTPSPSHRGLRDFFNAGSTIRIRGIQKFHPSLAELCRNIRLNFNSPARVNLYCTPANARGLDLHFDKHEVWIQQLRGKKRWQVYEPIAPRDTNDDGDVAKAEPGPLVIEAVLEPGDSLYLPRGFIHQAEALDEVSIHLTIGVHIQPIGEREQRPKVDLARSASLDHETALETENDLRVYVSADGSMTALARGENTFWMPSAFAGTLRFVAEHNSFCPNELPEITDGGKLALVRQLLENEFVRVAG